MQSSIKNKKNIFEGDCKFILLFIDIVIVILTSNLTYYNKTLMFFNIKKNIEKKYRNSPLKI